VTPAPNRLCTDSARGLIKWADGRAVRDHAPMHILSAWGVQV
jgi:hypothetical protein